MRILPREVDPMVYKMSLEDPGGASFAGIGGLGEQVRELREVGWTRLRLGINWLHDAEMDRSSRQCRAGHFG